MIVKSLGTAVPNFTLLTVNATVRLSVEAVGAEGDDWPPHEAADMRARDTATRRRAPEKRRRKWTLRGTKTETLLSWRVNGIQDELGCQRTFVSDKGPYCHVMILEYCGTDPKQWIVARQVRRFGG